MRAFLTLLVVTAACEGKAPVPRPSAPKDAAVAIDAVVTSDAMVNPNAGTGEPAPRPTGRKPAAFELREAALPKRTPCKAECNERHIPVAANACTRHAQDNDDMAGTVQIQLLGERNYGQCIAKSVVIDCCPAFKPTDYKGIANKLGWAKATLDERKAIAWVIARVVLGGRIVDEDMKSQHADELSRPVAREDHGSIVLDYWLVPDVRTVAFSHQQVTIAATGTLTQKVLDVEDIGP